MGVGWAACDRRPVPLDRYLGAFPHHTGALGRLGRGREGGFDNLGLLGGVVFFGHQIGSFLGVWLGGYLYDRTGSYDVVWMIAIALGVFAAIVNLPVNEKPIARAGLREARA